MSTGYPFIAASASTNSGFYDTTSSTTFNPASNVSININDYFVPADISNCRQVKIDDVWHDVSFIRALIKEKLEKENKELNKWLELFEEK